MQGGAALDMVVDLSAVPHIDTAGLRLLTRLAEQLRQRRQQLGLVVPPSSRILRGLMLTGLDMQMLLAATVDQAQDQIRLGEQAP